MSIPVELAALPGEIARFGARALLVSTSATGPPHVASVVVTVEADALVMRAGRKTRINIADRPTVVLVWSGDVDAKHCLIVDGNAREASDETLAVEPASAVLHRLAS